MAASERRIVALGGASLLPGSTDGPLWQHLLDLTREVYPRVCFIGTASGDDPGYIAAFYGWFARRAQSTHLGLFDRRIGDIEGFLLEHDLIVVGGGNTANMLAVWRLHGVDAVLRRAWQSGVVLAGPSAGAVCWFEAGSTDSFAPALGALRDGLGFLPGSFCPHYDSESSRRPRYHELVSAGELPDGYAADDAVGLVFTDTKLSEVVAAMPESRAFRVELGPNGVEESSIKPRLCAVRPPGPEAAERGDQAGEAVKADSPLGRRLRRGGQRERRENHPPRPPADGPRCRIHEADPGC